MMNNYSIWLLVEGRYLESGDVDGLEDLGIKVSVLDSDGGLYIRGMTTLRRVLVSYVDSRMGLGYGFPDMEVVVHVDHMESGRWLVLESSVERWRCE
jgi:FMN-dependent NADH-azoreductase